jgi:hypothetical protein
MTAKLDGTNGLIQQYDYQVLTTNFSYTFAAGVQTLVINPAGTLATGTIIMPAAPADGMTITFSSTQVITALTLSGNTGQTVVSGATTLAARQAGVYVYRSSNTSWYPIATVPTSVITGGTWVSPAGSTISSATAVASTSGTSVSFTSIPSWVKKITLMISGISSNAASYLQVQLGDSGGIEDSGYIGAVGVIRSTAVSFCYANSTGFNVATEFGGGTVNSGLVTIALVDSNTWVSSGTINDTSGSRACCSSGSKTLSGTLTQIRIIDSSTGSPSGTFTAGLVNILYE